MSAHPRALVDDGGARHLQRGRRMPDIELPTTSGRSVELGAACRPGDRLLLSLDRPAG